MYKTILITGASSGIGKSLAIKYAVEGVNLLLMARNEQRINEVSKLCTDKGANVETAIIDVTNKGLLEKQLLEWDDNYKIDLVYANAGISGGTSIYKINTPEQFDDVIDINIKGVFNTVNPLIPRMIERGKGHIALISSMAGFVGMPTAVAYSTSKVAVKAYGDGIRPLLKSKGVKVSTIFPGFIKTPMTDVNNFKMPFLIEASDAANIIVRKVNMGKVYISFPIPIYIIAKGLSLLPWAIRDLILSIAPRK